MKPEDKDQRIKELLLLERAAKKINSILDTEILLEEIVGDVLQTFGYTRSGVLLIDNATNELVIAAVRGWTVNYHKKGERFKIGEYGMVGHVAQSGKTLYAPDVSKNQYYQVSEESTKSELDIPLKVREKLIGVFNVQHQETHAFSAERIQMLETLADHISIAIENSRLFQKEHLEKERMSDELKEAKNIQMKLFPENSPVIPGFKIDGICIPCREVGGDWFDFISFDDGRLGIVLADVSGKGMGAALLMSSTRSILRLVADSNNSPGEVLKKINNVLIKDFPTAKFVTMVYAILDPAKKSLVFANAGHLYPLYINSGKTEFLKTDTGTPLGISEGFFSECKVDLPAGSKIIFYTDGVTEAMNINFEEYGTNRFSTVSQSAALSLQNILDDVNKFTAGNPATDDITLVMIESGN
jgi:sigma-B regulation protein RsbU (phosphoserine phosphatase)